MHDVQLDVDGVLTRRDDGVPVTQSRRLDRFMVVLPVKSSSMQCMYVSYLVWIV